MNRCNDYLPPWIDDKADLEGVHDARVSPPPSPPLEPCATVGEVAGLLGVSPRTVYRLIRARKLRKLPLGGAVRIARAELERLLR